LSLRSTRSSGPNSAFDNNITVYGPEVRALVVQRYLTQMIAELGALPDPDDGAATLLDGIELVVPHQANKTMVTKLATDAGLAAESLYFNIARVGNLSAASIPVAIHDAVQERVIDRPMRIFTPGFGAGAVGGYAVLRVDPAIVVHERAEHRRGRRRRHAERDLLRRREGCIRRLTPWPLTDASAHMSMPPLTDHTWPVM
jgi:3-oxoacyl-[acyl-carrier-protein (ACP)] synthase III-like protein